MKTAKKPKLSRKAQDALDSHEVKVPILFTVPDYVAKEIDKAIVKMPIHSASRAGFARSVVLEALGFEIPQTRQSTVPPRDVFKNLNTSELRKDTKRVVELYLEGRNLSSISRQMTEEGFPTRRGGDWHHHSCGNLLLEALAENDLLEKIQVTRP